MDETETATENEPPRYSPNAIHMMRTTQLAHIQLSAMADQKASILMGASFVIFTITVGQSRGAEAPLPLLILGGFAFLSAICAVMAVLPAFAPRRRPPLNLLFFGSFGLLGEEEYVEQITARLASDDSIYRTMARDIYQNGSVLRRKKYRMLAWAYRVFLAGLVASAAAFIWQALASPI
ncbi:MAG TPA: Pycsar system effector family protein [Allosphingosinicella sp.]